MVAEIERGTAPTGAGPWKQRLRPYQVEAGRAILDSVLRRRGLSFSVEIARQGGKNELSAQLEALLLLLHAGREADAIKCAPTFEPQGRISLRRLWSRLLEAGLARLASLEAGHVVRIGRARVVFLSAEREANVVGHSARLLLEVDEAQDVDEEKFDREFRPMASTANATTVFYGTAWDETTLLERAKQRHLELERRDGIRRHFEYDWETVSQYNPAYGRYVEAERERLGEQHPLFLTQYCLKPIRGGGRLFTPGQLAQLRGSHPRQRAPRSGGTYVAGLDLAGGALEEAGSETRDPSTLLRAGAGGGRDATVLTIGRAVYPGSDALVQEPRLEVVEHYSWTGEPHDQLLHRLADLLREVWQVRRLAVDATGLGETMARLLTAALGSHVVRPVRFTQEAKSRLGYGLLAAANGGRLKLYAGDGSPEERQCWRELERARAAYRANRTMNFLVEPAEGHDDYLMSLALLVEAGADAAPRTARGRVREA
ncbi:MAG: hypothetical protein A2148_02930 [Chloroflexi bacterium RBG_16_68_14]|nr:MAG: hypothetical protein A2148_02930 [Chloroflexi bacterium RBG_16_68_14]